MKSHMGLLVVGSLGGFGEGAVMVCVSFWFVGAAGICVVVMRTCF